MMPIVDPHVGLSPDDFSLDDYLSQSSRFHVLRMVAVQHAQSPEASIQGLRYMRSMSNTRGYGGFPNGVVAYCELTRADALSQLFEFDVSEILRGVHVDLTSGNMITKKTLDSERIAVLTESVSALVARALSLDVTVSVDRCNVVQGIAEQYATMPIVVNMRNWNQWFTDNRHDQIIGQLSRIAQHENVNVKLLGTGSSRIEGYTDLQKRMIDTCANLFGHERVMLASGVLNDREASGFDEQWLSYVNATQSYSARHRDQLFRSNAIRIYRL